MQIPVYDLAGKVVENIEVNDQVFAVPFNEGVVHQVMVAQRANARHGNASTKTRGEVDGSSKKLYRQKHTGYARMGSKRSPLRRKGGVVGGPKPKDWSMDLPKKMRQLAIRCVLSAKASDGELKVLKELKLDEPKTKQMVQILSALGVATSALVIDTQPGDNVIKSARNLKGIKTMPASLLNVVDLLSHKTLLMTVDAVRKAEELWGEKHASEVKHAA